jgi:hypothetical protein
VQHRRYMPLESFAPISNLPLVSLGKLTAPALTGDAS